jgi:hypothetical protein
MATMARSGRERHQKQFYSSLGQLVSHGTVVFALSDFSGVGRVEPPIIIMTPLFTSFFEPLGVDSNFPA